MGYDYWATWSQHGHYLDNPRLFLLCSRALPGFSDMNCDCSIDTGEYCEVYTATLRRARKGHTCIECQGAITPGEQYEHVDYMFEGYWDYAKTCVPCRAIRERYCHYGFIHGNLAERLTECLGFDHLTIPEADDDE